MEMLVRVVDKRNRDDIYKDVKLTKRGDVIDVHPDGWDWTKQERTAPYWRIIRVPDMARSEAEAMLVPEPGDPKEQRTLQRLLFKFDLDSSNITPELEKYIADNSRKVDIFQADKSLMRTLKTQKRPVDDPAIIKTSVASNVIGSN